MSLKGLELSRRYYQDCILPILKKSVPQIVLQLAAALIGTGSEVLGNDDLYSRDHDWGPRVVLFLPEETREGSSKIIFTTLEKQVPKELLGYPTRFMPSLAVSITTAINKKPS